MSGTVGYKDFQAIHDHMPGRQGALRITGTVVAPTTHWSARIEPSEANSGSNQLMLQLVFVLTEPPPGAPVLDVITEIPVEHVVEDSPIDYQEVEFVLDGPAGQEPPPRLEVIHPEKSEA